MHGGDCLQLAQGCAALHSLAASMQPCLQLHVHATSSAEDLELCLAASCCGSSCISSRLVALGQLCMASQQARVHSDSCGCDRQDTAVHKSDPTLRTLKSCPPVVTPAAVLQELRRLLDDDDDMADMFLDRAQDLPSSQLNADLGLEAGDTCPSCVRLCQSVLDELQRTW